MRQTLVSWMSALEANGFEFNVDITKVRYLQESAMVQVKCPYRMCISGVGSNSVLCIACDKWIFNCNDTIHPCFPMLTSKSFTFHLTCYNFLHPVLLFYVAHAQTHIICFFVQHIQHGQCQICSTSLHW